jgi:hypothetical protein
MTDVNQLSWKDKKIIFDRPIGVCLEDKGMTFVLVETTNNLVFPNSNFQVEKFRNVLGFNSEGKLSWTIQTAPILTEIDVEGPFTGLFFENEELITYHSSGINYLVDKKTGSIRARDQFRAW